MVSSIDIGAIAKPEPKRDHLKRYVLEGPDGNHGPYSRATTIADACDDTWALDQWGRRMTAYGLARSSDLLALASVHSPDLDRSTYIDIVDKSMARAKSDAKSHIGTAIHRAAELYDGGAPLADIPAQLRPHLMTYRAELEQCGVAIDPELSEVVVSLDTYKVAGTADRIVTLADGRKVIADIKSGSVEYSWLAIAIQMAIYANHDATHDTSSGARRPRVDVDLSEALIIHLPQSDADSCQLHMVNIAGGYEAFMTALEVRGHRKSAKKWARRYRPSNGGTGGAGSVGDWLRQRILTIGAAGEQAVTDLKLRWPPEVPRPLPPEPTTAEVAAMTQVLSLVEALHELPFGPERPGVEFEAPAKQKDR